MTAPAIIPVRPPRHFKLPFSAQKTGRGPAFARNLGAKFASGDVLVFLDSDVCVHHNTLQKIRASFDDDPELDALIGSYDSMPQSQDFLSQYRNLMHCYVHQTGARAGVDVLERLRRNPPGSVSGA